LNLISDTVIAAIFFESAFSASCFNVQINLKALNDKKLSVAVNKELSLKAKSVKRIRAKMEAKVGKIIRG